MISPMVKFIKQRLRPFCIAYLAKVLVKLVTSTCRIKVEGLETYIKTAEQQACILMLWHNRLPLVAELLNRFASHLDYVALISKSMDAEPLAILAQSYDACKVLRVSHVSRYQALRKMISRLKNGREIIIITPDGPRGPKCEVKQGIVATAQETDAHIIPFSWTASRFWQLKTWDRMIIPKPFSTIIVTFGTPVSISKESESIDQSSERLRQKLCALEEKVCTKLFKTREEWPV